MKNVMILCILFFSIYGSHQLHQKLNFEQQKEFSKLWLELSIQDDYDMEKLAAAMAQAKLEHRHMTREDYKACATKNNPLRKLDDIPNGLATKVKNTGAHGALVKRDAYNTRADAMRKRLAKKRDLKIPVVQVEE